MMANERETTAQVETRNALITQLEKAAAALWDAHYGKGIALGYVQEASSDIKQAIDTLRAKGATDTEAEAGHTHKDGTVCDAPNDCDPTDFAPSSPHEDAAPRPLGPGTGDDFADKLVDWVSTVTQLDPEKGQLPNVEDWRRNAAKLFDETSGAADDPSRVQAQGDREVPVSVAPLEYEWRVDWQSTAEAGLHRSGIYTGRAQAETFANEVLRDSCTIHHVRVRRRPIAGPWRKVTT